MTLYRITTIKWQILVFTDLCFDEIHYLLGGGRCVDVGIGGGRGVCVGIGGGRCVGLGIGGGRCVGAGVTMATNTIFHRLTTFCVTFIFLNIWFSCLT